MTIPTRHVSHDPQGSAFAKLAIAFGYSRGDALEAKEFASRFCRTQPQVEQVFDEMLREKSAIPAGAMSTAPWLGNLAPGGINSDVASVFPSLSGSAFAQLESRARQTPFYVPVPAQTGAAAGGWVEEGHPVPVSAYTLSRLPTLTATAIRTMVIVTRELLKANDPQAEQAVRDLLLRGLGNRMDYLFFNPASVAAAPFPGSVTSTGTQTGGGSPAALTAATIDDLFAAVTTSGGGLTFVASPQTYARACVALGRVEPAGRFCGLPIVLSGNLEPGLLVLIDLDELWLARGGFDLSVSTQASVQMDDSPTQEGLTPTASATVSLWQSNLIGFKFGKYLNWELAHTGAVSYTYLT